MQPCSVPVLSVGKLNKQLSNIEKTTNRVDLDGWRGFVLYV